MSEERTAEDVPLPGGDLRLFVTRLAYQGMLACGLIENPLTGTRQKNPSGARMVLDDIGMLLEKTQGNLTLDEKEHLDKVYADLTRLVAQL
ncbi:MAG: DUF1844 domain-containing protein [Planctomycetota bacterium]